MAGGAEPRCRNLAGSCFERYDDLHTGQVARLGTAMTARESEVLALLGQHLTNAQIAEALFISVRTVESHVAALLRKYQVADRRSLARLAAAGSAPAHRGAAGAGDSVPRPGGRARGAVGGPGRASTRHRGRTGRGRQDPAGDQRRRRPGRASGGTGRGSSISCG